jgi:hypothetical protein
MKRKESEKDEPVLPLRPESCTPEELSAVGYIRTQDFDKLLEEGTKIVDKTLFIKAFINSYSEVDLILRPRRFGKSTNLSMLKSFLSYGADAAKFDHLLIGKETEFVAKHCGKYPVVHLDMKDVGGNFRL